METKFSQSGRTKSLAEVCCFEEHRSMNTVPRSISLKAFLQRCIPDMISEEIYFGVFYNASREGLSVDGYTLKEALEDEVSSVWE